MSEAERFALNDSGDGIRRDHFEMYNFRETRQLIRCLFRYSCYIIAFGLGFYILLHKDDGRDPPAEGEEEEYPYFDHVHFLILPCQPFLIT